MKRLRDAGLIAIGLVFFFLICGCGGDDTCKPDTSVYSIRIVNAGSYDITSLSLHQVGAPETVRVDELAPLESTDYYEFNLPVLSKGDSAPISYGDYNGDYMQVGEEKHLYIAHPSRSATLTIDDSGYTTE
jgi:hypothetical protein